MHFRSLLSPLLLLATTAPALAGAPALLIEVADTGAYRISHAELNAAMPDLGEVDSRRLRLTHRGEPRPLHVDDGGDGRFGPGDHIRFYGERLHGPESWFDTYAVNNVYRLELDAQAVEFSPTPPTATGTAQLRRELRLEQENLQIRLGSNQVEAGSEPDLWFWSKLTQIDPSPFQTVFSLPDIGVGDVALTLGFRGMSRAPRQFGQPPELPDHEVEIRVNGALVRTVQFADRDVHTVDLKLANGRLGPSDNTIELTVPRRLASGQTDPMVDVVMFDYLHLDYPLAGALDERPLPLKVVRPGSLELSAPARSRSVTLYGRDGSVVAGEPLADGGRWRFPTVASGDYQAVVDDQYLAPAAVRVTSGRDWRKVDHGYDYLLISHASLAEAARPLAEFHRGKGLRVAEVDVADLYDAFNHGIVHPRAIRDFVAHAYHQWPAPRPRFVLLVGDASFDVRSDRAEDNRYAKWVNRELLIPDHFGEIPGQMYSDTDKLASKRNLIPTWQYPSEEGHSAADNYFVAVDGDDWLPDLAIGRFPVAEPEEVSAIVDKTIGYATNTDFGEWRRRALFTTDTSTFFQNSSDKIGEQLQGEGFDFTSVYAHKEEADNLPQINALNDAINEGQLLVHFIGHGGRYIWRTGPPDPQRNHDLFTLDHVAGLNNGDRLPMVLSMTCYSAPFDHPSADSIGERFLREPGKGAIAVFAASWRNTPTVPFSQAAVDELMVPGANIGEALMRAKRTLTKPYQRTLVETYNLLGDPAVVLQRPSLPVQLLTRSHGGQTVIEVSAPEDDVNGRAVVEWHDAEGALLARSEREVRGRRSRHLMPVQAADAAQVSVHLIDYASRRDGVARVALGADESIPDETATAENVTRETSSTSAATGG